jgi:hypothetical protein
VLDTNVGWRGTHVLVGASGVVVALLCAALMGRDPRPPAPPKQKGHLPDGSTGSLLESVLAVVSTRTLQLLFAGTALRFCAGFGLGVWKVRAPLPFPYTLTHSLTLSHSHPPTSPHVHTTVRIGNEPNIVSARRVSVCERERLPSAPLGTYDTGPMTS